MSTTIPAKYYVQRNALDVQRNALDLPCNASDVQRNAPNGAIRHDCAWGPAPPNRVTRRHLRHGTLA